MLNTNNIDMAVYYAVEQAMVDGGFVNMANEIIPRIIDGDVIESYLVYAEENRLEIESPEGISSYLPAIGINKEDEIITPGGLGGTTKNYCSYTINIFGRNKVESKLMAEAIVHKIRSKIDVYDYSLALPGDAGFPVTGQLIGSFHTEKLRNTRPSAPSLSLLDSVRRDVSFDTVYFEN